MRYINLDELIKNKQSRWGHANDLWKGEKIKKDFKNYFNCKCWYCESVMAGSDKPIDHFRPKSRVDRYKNYNYNKNIANTGYSWLKDDPKNYRCSCTYSNRKTGNGGKGCYFPLSDNSGYLASGSVDTSIEQPMLLDPCVKSDVKLLTFVSALPACSTDNDYDKKRVNVSIELYNLNDGDIKACRLRIWNQVMDDIEDYENGNMNEVACIRKLKGYISRDNPYSAAAIAAVLSWNNEDIKGKLDLEL